MLKRIMMIPISLAAAGGLPFLALNRDLATRFEAALDELTVPSQEEAPSEIVEIPSPFGSDSPFRLASAANDGTGTGSGTTRSNSSSSGAYGSGSSSSGTGGSGTSRSGTGTTGSGTGGSGTGGTSTYGSSTSGGTRPSGTSGSGTSGSGTTGSLGSTGSGTGSTSGAGGVGGTRTSNGVTTYGSGAAAAAGGTSSGSGTAGSTGSAGRSASGSTSTGGSTTGSSTAGTGFSAPPLSAGQELRNPTPGLGLGLGLGLGEGRGGGDWPTTPVLGNDYREVFRFDVTPNWVKANWPRVSTGWTEDQLEGYRVPLVTGTRVNDLTGSLTFFFDAEHRVQRLRFVGNTGDASRLVELVTRYFDMELEPTRLAGLYTRRYHGKPVSVLRIAHDSVLRADRPNLQLSIVLEINNPRGSYKLSDAVGELLATDPPISSR